MPDILICMEMPKTCADCHDADLPTAIAWLDAKCPWAHGIIDPGVYDLHHERHPDCPLHELPPHGNLISREQAFQMMLNRGYQKEAAGVILEVPTVIPASEEGNHG